MARRRNRLDPQLTDPTRFEGEFRIDCTGITRYYHRQPVLDRVDFRVQRGTMVGLIGPGASGKSLLVKIICGLVEADRGQVLIDGIDMGRLREHERQALRGRIGMVFQNYALFDFMDVGENIALPLRMEGGHDEDEISARVAAMLEQVALPGIERKLPSELSGGMKKRVSFARAVINRPEIVIYDDPTAGLDPVTSAKISRLLEQMQATGTTSIAISHDLDGLRPLCDRWVLLDQGRIVFEGSTDEIDACDEPFVRQFWRGEPAS